MSLLKPKSPTIASITAPIALIVEKLRKLSADAEKEAEVLTLESENALVMAAQKGTEANQARKLADNYAKLVA